MSGIAAKLRVALSCALFLLASAPRAGAQTCAGDCNGDTAVTIGELIRAVGIALGNAPLDNCVAVDVNGNGQVSIAELVQAVNRALLRCPATQPPTATPTTTATPSATATPTVSATPTQSASATPTAEATATPTPSGTPGTPTATISYPNVTGVWREDPLHLVSSTCLEIIAVAFAEELAQRPPCEHQVANVESVVTLVDCNDRAVLGSVDTLGVITYSLPEESGTIDDCSIALTADVRVAAGLTPTTATYAFELNFGGSCPLPTCTVTAAGPWTLLP